MRQSHLYFIGAALFLIAVGLNIFNEGVNLKTAIGPIFAASMIVLGLSLRKAGK